MLNSTINYLSPKKPCFKVWLQLRIVCVISPEIRTRQLLHKTRLLYLDFHWKTIFEAAEKDPSKRPPHVPYISTLPIFRNFCEIFADFTVFNNQFTWIYLSMIRCTVPSAISSLSAEFIFARSSGLFLLTAIA